jgi:F0F1-type ATP synthase assembly protein I
MTELALIVVFLIGVLSGVEIHHRKSLKLRNKERQKRMGIDFDDVDRTDRKQKPKEP